MGEEGLIGSEEIPGDPWRWEKREGNYSYSAAARGSQDWWEKRD